MDLDLKGVLDSIRTSTEGFSDRLGKMQTQLDAVDLQTKEPRGGGGIQTKSLIDHLKESEEVQRLLRDKRGSAILTLSGKDAAAVLARKSTITATTSGSGLTPVGVATSGVLGIDRIPGIVPEARQDLTIRDVLFAQPTTMQVVDFVKVSTPMTIASPAPEASLKAENAVTFTTVSERVKTIATWIPATRQVLDDFQELEAFLNSTLAYYLDLAEELQILAGDGTGENLHGLIPQASAFSTALLTPAAGYNYIDQVGHSIQQAAIAKEIQPTFVVLNPRDWGTMRLLKDGFGHYILGDPQANVTPSLFNLRVVSTTSIAAGTFLVGSGSRAAAEIRDRMETQVEISTQHADWFVRNLIAVRAEKRLALLCKRPAAFISGTFASSPA